MSGVRMSETERGDRAGGIALIGAAGLSVLAMAHHPTSVHAGAMLGIVHAAMILFAGMLAFGFTHFARRCGLARPAVLAGLVAYAIGTFASIGAATVNGFAAPALAADGATHAAFDILWAVNQALAKLGVIAAGAAYVLWSIELWRRSKVIALLGLLAGGVPALLLTGGWIGMRVNEALLIYAAQLAWAALVGWLLLRGGLAAADGVEEAPR